MSCETSARQTPLTFVQWHHTNLTDPLTPPTY